ncbi:F-box protein skip23 [Rhynchospora pubera]|uniref:F-box protein skip23 n=1 Tax=Rhynchospora pubera TaxID=906938 RepID=A0AAV8G4S7_9POAL|nr:F-box protein skip23 [Rhynchospora pubera]
MEAIEPSLPLRSQKRVRVDWSDLPVDLLQEISKKLHDVFDFVYFRAVCKKWRSAASISDLPPQLPWLVEHPVNAQGIEGENLRFYSFFSDKIRTLHCPMARGKCLIGPSHGYLYACKRWKDPTPSLFNPLTKDEVTIQIRRDLFPFLDLESIGPDPIGTDSYMAFTDARDMMGFYRPCSCEWNYVELPIEICPLPGSCLKGRYYMNDPETGDTVVIDIACGSSFVIPAPKTLESSDRVYFVESTGNILRIVKHKDQTLSLDLSLALCTSNFSFDIYQLCAEDDICQSRWVKINSIGNQIVFLDDRNGISITARPSTGMRINSVYFLQRCSVRYYGDWVTYCEVYKYSISDGRTEKVLCPFSNGRTWFVPNLVTSVPAGHQLQSITFIA